MITRNSGQPDRLFASSTLFIRPGLHFRAVWIFSLALIFQEPLVVAGEPWVGEMGVTATTREIMERSPDYERLPKLGFRAAKKHPLGRIDDDTLLADTASPSVGDFTNAEPPLAEGQSVALSFTGATLNDTLAFPPDSMGAVGPSQVIVAVNGRIRSFSKTTGVADGVLNINPDVFFNSVLTPPANDNFTSDPRIRYDRLTDRWFTIIIDVPGRAGAQPNRILFAVSDSGVITPSTVWTFFQFQHDQPTPQSNSDNGKFADYPTLGLDANALYIGVNIFGTRGVGSFSSTTAFVVRKSSLLGAGPIVVTPFRDLTSNNPNQSGSYTPQGVDNLDPGATEGYFIGVASRLLGQLVLHRISDPGGNPTLSEVYLSVPLTGQTITVPHLGNDNGTSGRLDGLDRRLMAAHVRNGRLWTCANIAVDNTGAPGGTDTRMGIRWYELDGIATGQTLSIVQSGTVFEPSVSNTTNQRHYWMGTIMTSGQGHALMGFSTAGETEYVNAGYAGRLAGDPAGTFRAPVFFTASSSAYNPPSNPGGSNGRRWGDYSYTAVDPDDDMTLWTFQEWCLAPNSYAVQVARVLAPPPALPDSASPSMADAGQSNLNITVTGTVSDGEGFFDPGPGFPNHITASIDGGGVVVNTVTYNNPTNLTLNVSIEPDAVQGLRTITVTNPDGQSETSQTGLFTINAIVSTNNPPTLDPIGDQFVDEGSLLTFMAAAGDPDGDSLTYLLGPGAPAGAGLNATNGLFSWTPTETRGPSSNLLSIIVEDDGSPVLSATQAFSVVVAEVNLPPQLDPVSNQNLHAGMTVTFTNGVADPDIPTNTLTFSLDPGAPAAATIDPVTGVFTWSTTDADINPSVPVTIRVTDDGVPPLDDARAFSLTVADRPTIQSIESTNGAVQITWSALEGLHYRLQYKPVLTNETWTDLPDEIIAPGATAAGQDTGPTNPIRFYRVRTQP